MPTHFYVRCQNASSRSYFKYEDALFAMIRDALPSEKERSERARYRLRGGPRIVLRKSRVAYDEAALARIGRCAVLDSIGRKKLYEDILSQEGIGYGVLEEVVRERGAPRMAFFGRRGIAHVRDHEEMKSRIYILKRQEGSRRGFLERLDQGVANRLAPRFRSVDMAVEVALLDEARKGHLVYGGNRAGIESHALAIDAREMRGKHHVGDAEGRSERLREGVRVDDAFGPVDSRKRRNGFSGKAKLAVVVVFDDVSAWLFRSPG